MEGARRFDGQRGRPGNGADDRNTRDRRLLEDLEGRATRDHQDGVVAVVADNLVDVFSRLIGVPGDFSVADALLIGSARVGWRRRRRLRAAPDQHTERYGASTTVKTIHREYLSGR